MIKKTPQMWTPFFQGEPGRQTMSSGKKCSKISYLFSVITPTLSIKEMISQRQETLNA